MNQEFAKSFKSFLADIPQEIISDNRINSYIFHIQVSDLYIKTNFVDFRSSLTMKLEQGELSSKVSPSLKQ